jgi:ABC-type uncharacterized transport system involved in gliding motility auxiliary subunit
MTSDPRSRVLLVVGWACTALVAAAAGRFAALDPTWDRFLVFAAITGTLGVLAYVVSQVRYLLAGAKSGQVSAGVRHTAALTAGFVLLAGLNYLATRHSWRFDLTTNDVHALSDSARDVLTRLDGPVRVTVFARQGDLPVYRDRWTEFSKASAQVLVDFVDYDAQPGLVRQYEVEAPGTVVLEYKQTIARATADSEQELTDALLSLLEGKVRKAYFTTGHAERDIDSSERVGYTEIAAALRRANFAVEKINLAEREGAVPPDATVVIVAGPRADLFRAEADGLQAYLAKGGKALFLIDPFDDLKRYITESGTALFMMDPASAEATAGLRNVIALINDWGVAVGDDVVVDTSGMGQFLGTDASVPVAGTYPPHEITKGFTSITAYPMARSVSPLQDGGGHKGVVRALIETGPQTWAESDITQLASGTLSLDPEAGDRPGPLLLGVAVSAPLTTNVAPDGTPLGAGFGAPETRLAVLGDSDFAANYSANIPGNRELFLGIVKWLSQQEVVTIPPRQFEERQMVISGAQRRNLSWLAMFALPLLLCGVGLYVWANKGE